MNDKIDLNKIKKNIKDQQKQEDLDPIRSRKRFGSSPIMSFIKYIIIGVIIALLIYTIINVITVKQASFIENNTTGIEIIQHHLEASEKAKVSSRIKDPLEFYYYLKLETFSKTKEITEYDMKDLSSSEFFLNKEDLYRINLNPAGKAYCYVFQFNSEGYPLQIHPTNGSFFQMIPSTDYYIPPNNAWIQASDQKGLNTLYIITSFSFLPELENLYVDYLKAKTDRKSKLYASQLKLYLETLNNISFNGFRKLQLIFS